MAINLPQGLYTAGAVPLDVSQSTNFANQLALKQQARQDSLNEYYQNINKSINPEGIRPQDTSGFMSKYNDFTNFYSQNRSAIQNPRLDGGKAQAEYNSRHLDLMSDADKSKQAQGSTVELWKAKSSPGSSYMFNSPDIMPAIHHNDLSIYDPQYKQLNVDELQANARPLGVKDLNAIHAGLMKGLGTASHPIGSPNPDGQGNAYQNMEYSQDEKQGYINRAQQTYNSDPTVRAYAASIVADPVRAAQAAAAYYKLTGQHAQTDADMFAGEFAAADDLDKVKPVKVSDAQTKSNIIEGRQKTMSNINYGHAVDLKELGNSLSYGKTAQEQEADFKKIKQFGDDLADPAIAGKGMNMTDENGQPVTEYKMNLPQSMYKTYKQPGADGQEPSQFTVDRGKTYTRATYPDGTSKKVSWGGFLTDIGNALRAARYSMRPTPPPAALPGTPAPAGAKPTKSDQDLLNQYGIKIQ